MVTNICVIIEQYKPCARMQHLFDVNFQKASAKNNLPVGVQEEEDKLTRSPR